MGFIVEAEGRIHANRLAEDIQNVVAAQVENKVLFDALQESEVSDIYFWKEEK